MSIAEGVQARVAYKFYASGAMTANAKAVSASDLGASSAQALRRVTSTLNLKKDTYQSAEIREDQQVVDYSHGSEWVEGSVTGEYSPATYKDFFQASFRGTWAAAVTASQADFTSATFDATAGTVTFAGGDPVAQGYRVGMLVRFASTVSNNSIDYLILAFSGGSNRVVSLFPSPVTEGADSSFTMTSVGKSLIMPVTQATNVNRKLAIEHYHADIGLAKLHTELRVGGFKIDLPANGQTGIEFMFRGRDREVYEGTDSPFFTSPTAETTTSILKAVNGLLRVGGSTIGVCTGLSVSLDRGLESHAVVGQRFHPEIHLKRSIVTGQMTVDLQDGVFFDDFKNETEIDILAYLKTTSAAVSPAATLLLPRVKFSDDASPLQGEAAQQITVPFQALRYVGSGAGIPSTTLQIIDTEA